MAIPSLFMMNDAGIREMYGCGGNAEGYVNFMLRMNLSAKSLIAKAGGDKESILCRSSRIGRTLPRLLDIYNYNVMRPEGDDGTVKMQEHKVASKVFEPHEGTVDLVHSFDDSWEYLNMKGPLSLTTSTGSSFKALSSIVKKGSRSGSKVILFKGSRGEYARSYDCCWGRYYNCYGTRHGMYCKVLDDLIN
jgi:hypothetical protein